ncbi:MAG: hypothetical protein ACI399_06165 [Candidatus Cryptobacteroides sp.]
MRKVLLRILEIGVFLLFVSCEQTETVYPSNSDWSAKEKLDTLDCIQQDVPSIPNEELALQKLNSEFLALNTQFQVAATKSGSWSWPRFWSITGSDAVGAIIGWLIGGGWTGLGMGVASSVKSYKIGKAFDDNNHSQNNNPPSTNGNSIYATTSFVGYDENGNELSYDCELEEDVCIDDLLGNQLGTLHNKVIISLTQEYGDSLALMSNTTIANLSIGRVAIWYGLDDSDIERCESEDEIFEACTLENEADFDSLTVTYPEYTGYFPIVKNYIEGVSQLTETEDILDYQTQAIGLIQNSDISSSAKVILKSGLDVLICSKGLWIFEEELEEEEPEEEEIIEEETGN